MGSFGDFAGGTALLTGVGVAAYFALKYFKPACKVSEYVSWFKIGRIRQFATEKGISIDETIAYDEARDCKAIRQSWTEKIEEDLAKDLGEVAKKERVKKEKKNGRGRK